MSKGNSLHLLLRAFFCDLRLESLGTALANAYDLARHATPF